MPTDAPSTTRGFVHLHLHSEYSLLDGGNRVDKLVARVKELGMDAVAVTDHGNMHAAVSFYQAAKSAGVKPILGVEAYVAPKDRRDKTYTGVQDGGWHLVLLAENREGWDNLLYLCSEAYRTGFYYKPRMDRELLEAHGAGLIAIDGHLGSELAHHMVQFERTNAQEHWDNAVAVCDWKRRAFAGTDAGPGYFVELQHHIGEQIAINPHLIRLAREQELPLVCDNDSHFLTAEDHDAHDTLICISMGKVKNDPDRLKYPTELYVKSPEEMWDIFGSDEYNNDRFGDAGRESLDNTVRIAERCDVDLPLGENHAPVVVVDGPEIDEMPSPADAQFDGDLTAWFKHCCAQFELSPADDPDLDQAQLKERCDAALRALSEMGMVWRYGAGVLDHRHEFIEGHESTPAAREQAADAREFDKWARLNRELKILADKLISAYFLIVWDFVNWGRQRGIPAMARGSGVGTMVGYVLGLSNACPVHYGLLFERFTDPDRAEYPDIDIDLCQDGRGEVIEYVREKYGHVAQIITFGTLKARAAVRDVARVLEVPLPEADKVAKLIPEQLGMTLDAALKAEPELKKLYDTDPAVKQIIDTGRVFEGQARHSSVHAAGVIVATRPLDEVVPLYKASGAEDHEIVTQWDGPTCERMGLLKMDFLGLRTLSVIERCKALIEQTLPEPAVWSAVGREAGDGGPQPLDLDRLTYDDQTVFEMFRRGDATGVFQFESGGMRRLLTEMRPDRLEDLIAANALFRPGPMDLIPDYNRRKHGQAPVPTVHPIVDKFTAETYGVMVYQEQVMQIVHELGGIPLRAAYALIKAISKKKKDKIDAARPKFIEGAGAQGLAKKQAQELFELILKFAGYGFNKSHSTGYAIVAYQTAYLKTYFPAQYMAAFLTYESQAQKVSDWIPYLDDCRTTKRVHPESGEIVASGVEVRPPDVNLSQADFTVVFEDDETPSAAGGHIRFGLRAIKGAGAKAIDAIITERDGDEERPRKAYTSLFDFAERVPPGVVNKATIEALIKSGAFDAVHGRDMRSSLVASIDAAVNAGQSAARDKAAGQGGLFGAPDPASDPETTSLDEAALVKAPAWDTAETLLQEKETLGFYVSSHPLESWRAWADAFTNSDLAGLADKKQDDRVRLAVMIQSIRTIVCKNGRSAGQKMAILTCEDRTGTADAVLFADAYAQFGHMLDTDSPKFILGRLDLTRGGTQILVDRVAPIDGVPLEGGRVKLVLREARLNGSARAALQRVREVLADYKPTPETAGEACRPLDFVVDTESAYVTMQENGAGGRVRLEPGMVGRVDETLGEQSVFLVGGFTQQKVDNDRRRGGPRRSS